MSPTVLIVLAGVGVLGLWSLVWHGRRSARRARRAAREAVHTVSVTGRVLVTAGVITAGQYAVVRYLPHNLTLLVVLAVPALLAAVPVVRAMTVTHGPGRRGVRR